MKTLEIILNEAYGVVPGDPIGDVIKQAQAKKQQPTPAPTNKPTPAPAKKSAATVQPQPMTGTTLENVLRDVAIRAGIVGNELAQFLAQCAHETANFTTLSEFGNSKSFLKYDLRVDPAKAKQLGNTQPGDGERYKGRGYLQITGRFNYAQIGQALGLPLEQKPHMLEDPSIAAQASIWFWKNRVKPKVGDFANTKAVTSVINPSLRGLQQRHGNFKDYVSTTSIPPEFAVKEGNISAEDLIDIYVKGKFKGKSVTFPVAKAFPNKFLERVIKKLVDKYNVNPNAIVYGPTKQTEDYDPNDVPPGPETKPTMPKGTVKVDVSDVYDWYKLGQHISNLKGLGKHDFGKGPPSTILSFGDEDTEHKYIKDLEKTGLTTTDIDPIDPRQPKGMKRQKVDPTYNVGETFNDKRDIKLTAKHYFPIDDQEIIEKYKIRKDSKGYYLPEFNTSGRIFNLNITSLMRLYGRPHSVQIDSIDEAKKKKRKKLRWAAYGPGPFGLYGGDTGYSGGDGGVAEGFPNFNREWDEATRYPEFVNLGKKKWIELVSKGKQVTVTRKNVNKINNTDAADPTSFKLLDPEKQKRALAQLANGDVEMPIVARYSDGYLELIGGNTRLTAQMAKDGQAKVWLFNVPEELTQVVAEGNEINREVEDLVQQVDFVDIVYKIARQKYPQTKFEKLDDLRIQVDVSVENNNPFDYKNYQGFFVMGMTYSNDEGTEVGVLINDAYTGPYKGIISPAIKLATEKCLQLVPNATPTLWVDADESGGIWNEIAKKLGYKFEILNEGKQGIAENFADGKVKGKSRPGRVKRAGASCNGSVTALRQRAKNASGEKAKMYHWCANMKSGKKK